MNSLRKLAEDYYNFILKYDECFYKKYQKEELLKVKILFNEMLEKYSRPYKKLTSGKEIEELEYILSNDSDTLMNHLKMFNYLGDECYDLAKKELKEYYDKNNIKESQDKINEILIKCMENNTFDSKYFHKSLLKKVI